MSFGRKNVKTSWTPDSTVGLFFSLKVSCNVSKYSSMSNNRLSFGKKHRNNLDTWLHFPATSCSSKCWAGGRADKLHGGIPESFCKYKYNNKCKHKCKQLLLRQIFSSSWKCSIQLTFISLNECLWVYGAENPQIAQKQNHKPNTNLHLRTFLS